MNHIKALAAVLLLIVFGVPLKGFALRSAAEFWSIDDDERRYLEGPAKFDSEYQSDRLAYSKTYDWHYQWLSREKILDVGLGSVSSYRFFVDNRLKVQARLLDDLEFRFIHFQHSDFDEQASHNILEFVYHLSPHWGMSVFGEGFGRKSQDDVGFAIFWWPSFFSEHKLYRTFPNFDHNERNEESDEFSYMPTVWGVSGKLWDKHQQFLLYDFRYEGKSIWIFPDESEVYEHWERFSQIVLRRSLMSECFITFDLEYTKKLEGFQNSQWLTDRFVATVEIERPFFEIAWSFVGGLQFADRFWQSDAGDVRHQAWLPHLWLKQPWSGAEFESRWTYGYEFTVFNAQGPAELRSSTDRNSAVEHRLNVGYDMRFSQISTFKLLFTFDLDRFGTGETWEGGSGQFQLLF